MSGNYGTRNRNNLTFYVTKVSCSYPGGNLLLSRYHASTAVGFIVLAGYWWDTVMDPGVVLARPLMITRLRINT